MCFYIYFYVSASDLYIDRLATGLYIDRPEKKVKNCPNQKKIFNIPFYAKKFKNMKFCKILTNISILGIKWVKKPSQAENFAYLKKFSCLVTF